MKFRVASDLHFEFHADRGATVAAELASGFAGVDALVLAGDVSDASGIHDALALLAETVPGPLVYVTGNHEFYGSDRQWVTSAIRTAVREHSNLHWLDHEAVTIAGQRFLGTPLWFRKPFPNAPKWAMNDFSMIRSFEAWVYEENRKALAFLEAELCEGDVVVTHYLPTDRSVAPQFRGSALNPFFLCEVGPLIEKRGPQAWVHGHTHCSCRYRKGQTEIICNPFGYAGHDLNAEYRTLDVAVTTDRGSTSRPSPTD